MISLLLMLSSAHAATGGGTLPEINAQEFRPSIDAQDFLWTDDAFRGPEGQRLMARGLVHYANDPLIYIPDEGEVIGLLTSVLQADILAAVRFSRFRVGLDLPVYLRETGTAGSATGLGDIALDGKAVLLDGESAPLRIALGGRIGLPVATVDAPHGSPTPPWELSAIVDKEIGDNVILAANLGTRGGPATELENISLNDSFLYRVGAGYRFTEQMGSALEIAGQLPYSAPLSNPAGSTMEWLASGWYRASDALVLRLGAGTGILSGIGSPDFRVVVGLGWEPKALPPPPPEEVLPPPPPDTDGDGMIDAEDACPQAAEDVDTYKDQDGCPDPESPVTMRVVDKTTQQVLSVGRMAVTGPQGSQTVTGEQTVEFLPGSYTIIGTAPGYDDGTAAFTAVHGAMEVTVELTPKAAAKIIVTRDRIDLKESINFATGRAVIMKTSFAMLDQVAQTLKDYAEIREMLIEGHTDNRGNDATNLKLSADRATSVRQYLINKGVDGGRLVSMGLGETVPLDPANNEAAWAKNRRVEMKIKQWVEIGHEVEAPPAPAPTAPAAPPPETHVVPATPAP